MTNFTRIGNIKGDKGDKGDPGDSGIGSSGVEVVISSAAATWTIPVPPSLGRVPSVMVFVDGHYVIADVVADSATVTVTHPEPTVGLVVLT